MMFRLMAAAAVCLGVMGPVSVAAEAVNGTQTYDLLFRTGTLDAVPRDRQIVYRRDVSNRLQPQAGTRDTGTIAMVFDPGDKPLVKLEFQAEQGHRTLGQFPASVGNPMIMYFYETVVRDMAESAGGSPFYIRNRVKEALIEPSEVIDGEAVVDGRTVATHTIRLQPFAGDPNTDRMQGFGDLALEVTMSDAVPGWYLSLIADVPGAAGADGSIYRSEIAFEGLEVRP